MNKPIHTTPTPNVMAEDLPIIAVDIPVMYEDEGQEEMGETDIHWRCCEILRNGLIAHFGRETRYRVFSDLNLYYHPLDRFAYVTPDVFAVLPVRELSEEVTSCRLGKDCHAPELVIEVLSRRSAQQQDLTNKPYIYAALGVPEYILVDVTGHHLAENLRIKHLQPDDLTWFDEQDTDGGVTSRLGFRIVIDDDGMVRMINCKTGERYLRPEETHLLTATLRQAEQEKQQAVERIRQLEEQLAQMQRQNPKPS